MPEQTTTRSLVREVVFAVTLSALVSGALVWLGPPGGDLAAHLYQRTLFIENGFALWNNFWYAGRYSFVTYSVIYYPLAALLGIRLLAVASVALGVAAFTVLVGREWGKPARWSSRAFAVVWAAVVLTGAFPFILGAAFALVALCALQAGRRRSFVALVLLTTLASPVAFLLLFVVLGAIAIEQRRKSRRFVGQSLAVAGIVCVELILWRAFPSGGRYPFAFSEAAAACTFCLLGLVVTWRVEAASLLRRVFLIYLCACIVLFAVPSSIGENIVRLRYLAIPIVVLALSLRAWRPRIVVVLALALTAFWNVAPLAGTFVRSTDDPAANAAYWHPAVTFLKKNLTASYRVEAVDTSAHWPAVYLAGAGIPLARGWFRQDDFPQNTVLYKGPDRRAYLGWLRNLGVRYVVVSSGLADYSARDEQRLIASGRSGLRPVFGRGDVMVYEVPRPRGIVTGPGHPRVLALGTSKLRLGLDSAGTYRVAVRYSPYWQPSSGCVSVLPDGMMQLHVRQAGVVSIRFVVNAERALATVAGVTARECSDSTGVPRSPFGGVRPG